MSAPSGARTSALRRQATIANTHWLRCGRSRSFATPFRQERQMAGLIRSRGSALAAGGVYALAWCASAAVLAGAKGDGLQDAVAILVIMGMALPLLGWLLTLGTRAP